MSPAENSASPLVAPVPLSQRSPALAGLIQLLSPPVFPDDETRTLRAYFLNVVLLLKLATQLLAPIIWSGTLERRVLLTSIWIVTALVPLILMRRGYLRSASVLHLVTSWLLVTLAVATCGGVRAPGMNAYILVAGSAGLLLGWQALVASVAASLLAGVAIMHAETAGILDPSLVSETLVSAWLTSATTLIVAAVHIGMAMRAIRKSLERVHRELAERKATEAQLREHQLELQSLSSRLLLSEERQRRGFSQMLHDHIGQNLAFAKIKLNELSSSAMPSDDASKQAIANSKPCWTRSFWKRARSPTN
jgi:signal transduction histidine kinase